MKINSLHTKVPPNIMDDIIKAIKQRLGSGRFSNIIYREMRRFGLGEDHDIFNEITAEMRRRSALVRGRSGNKSKGKTGRPDYMARGTPYYKYMVQRAAKYARDLRQQAMVSSDVLDVDLGQIADQAAEKFDVATQDVLEAM